MPLIDLLQGQDGRLSHLKLWNNVAAGLFTVIVVHREWVTARLSDDLLIWYAGMLIAGVVVNKGVTLAAEKK